jgi:small subunit ribosomal protein S20
MATSVSAKKRIRQNEQHRLRNRAEKSRFRTAVKRFEEAVESKNVDQASALLKHVTSYLDKAARKNVIHRNKAAREKSNLQQKLNRLAAGAPK